MRSPLTAFAWPALPGSQEPPRWVGDSFLVGDRSQRVLSYEAADSHWNAELTALHECEAGANHPIDQASRALAVRSLRRFMGRERIVLDVGCSSGFLLEELRRLEPSWALVGSDFILPPLLALGRRLAGVPLLQFDLRTCPLPDDCLEAVTALNVLEHIDEHDVALRQIWRVLKPAGVAHVEVPAGPGLYDIYDEHLLHRRRYRLRELVHMARAAGFEVLRATHLGALLYPAFAWVKKRNRRLLDRPEAEKKMIVARQIRTTSHNPGLRAMLRLELALGRYIKYPLGIRCVVVLRKVTAVHTSGSPLG